MADPISLYCAACRKKFKVRNWQAGKTYHCPTCKGPMGAEAATQAATVGAELAFRDEPPVPRELPVRLGKYLIDGEVARGGMGVVYKGRQEGLDRVVAIKMLLGGYMGDSEMVQRFHREARAAAKLRHPNIVSIHEVGEHDGRPFFTMDFIRGKSLDGLLREAPLTVPRGVAILRDVARAVHYAHGQGILHRDLKPGNIMVDPDDKPHVTDFGLARDMDSKSMLSVTGEVLGTPSFMSPEQAEGRVRELDQRSDIYSLGAILYRLLTGKPPFEGPTVAATIYKVVHEYTTEPVKLNPRVGADVSAVCMKALEKEPKDRYASADALAQDLDRILQGEPVLAKPPSRLDAWKRTIRKNRKAATVVAAVCAAAVVAVAAVLLLFGKSELDLIEENLGRPEMRLTAMGSLLNGLGRFGEKSRALEMARKAVAQGTDDAARELAYAEPKEALAGAYVAHLGIPKPEKLRIRVIRILASLKYGDAVPDMLRVMGSARGPVRLEAVRFFQAVPDVRAYYALGMLISDRECGPDARMALRRQPVDTIMAVFNPAAGSVGGALTQLGDALDQANRQFDEALSQTPKGRPKPKDAVEAAIEGLRNPEKMIRMKAADALGLSGDARAREPLVQALSDPEDPVLGMAAASLGLVGIAGQEDKVAALLKAARPAVRRGAAFVLGKTGQKALRPAVEAALKVETDTEAKYAMEDALVALR